MREMRDSLSTGADSNGHDYNHRSTYDYAHYNAQKVAVQFSHSTVALRNHGNITQGTVARAGGILGQVECCVRGPGNRLRKMIPSLACMLEGGFAGRVKEPLAEARDALALSTSAPPLDREHLAEAATPGLRRFNASGQKALKTNARKTKD